MVLTVLTRPGWGGILYQVGGFVNRRSLRGCRMGHAQKSAKRFAGMALLVLSALVATGASPAPAPAPKPAPSTSGTGVSPVSPALAAAMAKITKSPNPTLADWQKLVESKPKGLDFKPLCPIGPGNFIMSLCQDLQGRIYAGTEGDGLWSFDPSLPLADQWHHFTRANTGGPPEPNGATIESGNFLGDDYIYALACDKLGRIFCGHLNHGISVYNGQSWKNFNVLEGPLGERLFALTTCPTDGDIWMATSAGLARYSLKKDTWSYFTRAEGLSSDQANTLAFAKDGTIFVGLQADGINIADAKDDYKTWRAVHAPKALQDQAPLTPTGDGLPTDLINQILVTRGGTVYVATPTGLAFGSDKGQKWKFIRGKDWAAKVKGLAGGAPKGWTESPGAILSEDYCTSLAEDAQSHLWVGHRESPIEDIFFPANKTAIPACYAAAMMNSGGLIAGGYGEGLLPSPGEPPKPPADMADSRAPTLPAPAITTPETFKRLADALKPSTGPQVRGLYMGEDWTTAGDWFGRYGYEFACLLGAGGPSSHFGTWGSAYTATPELGPHHNAGDVVRGWVAATSTEDHRSLFDTLIHTRCQAEADDHGETYSRAFDGPDIWLHLSIPDPNCRITLYFVNNDGHTGKERYRDYVVELRPGDATTETLAPIARCRVMNFWGGVYKQFFVPTAGKYSIHISRNYSLNSIASGAFVDALPLASSKTLAIAPGMGQVMILPPKYTPIGDLPEDPAFSAAKSFWDAAQKSPAALVTAEGRLLSLRAATAGSTNAPLLDNWRWICNQWTAGDREKFEWNMRLAAAQDKKKEERNKVLEEDERSKQAVATAPAKN